MAVVRAKVLFAFAGLLLALAPGSAAESIEDKIKNDSDLSEFLILLGRSKLANVTLQYKSVTIFAPINAAFQKYGKPVEDPNVLVLYHMTSVPKKTEDLVGSSSTSLYSELEGSPPLWITYNHARYNDEVFVNNARLFLSQSNIATQKENMEQVLHKIDEVLIPTRSPKSAQDRIYNPTAWEFLEHYQTMISRIDPHRLRHFFQKVQKTHKQDIFKTEGGHTFFIPVDDGFKDNRADRIDGKIIDGHVIPGKVLFTTPTPKDVPFQTIADSDGSVRVVISFTQETRGKNVVINYVKSHTLLSDGSHSQGVVLSEIVKPNIPVKNGVVHLIQKPLMVVDNNVKELLEEKEGGILNNFVKAIKDTGFDEFYNLIERSNDVTLFAPCNSAFTDDFSLNSIIRNKQLFKNILKMHLVVGQRLYVDRIMNLQDKRVKTYNERKSLYFNVITSGLNRTVTIEGGGVNSTVIQADLAATNGVIHIIDRVLGVPYTTVLDKLRTDPMLNSTYILGSRGGFNYQLNDTTKKFTYFVPSYQAWANAFVYHPSAAKKLFMPEYSYHASHILERHLVVSDEPYTMERIKQLNNLSNGYGTSSNTRGIRREITLPAVRGELRFYVEEEDANSFKIHWKGEKITVIRPNVACTNGIIHVIDAPFLQDGDVRVNGATALYLFSYQYLIGIFVAKWFIL